MIIKSIHTDPITTSSGSIYDVLDRYLTSLEEGTIVVITSKIVSICEGRVRSLNDNDKEKLYKSQADKYLPAEESKYNHHFSYIHNKIIGSAGIDESNGNGDYVLLPENPQQTANSLREYLADKFKLNKLGVVITDSASVPLQRGSTGISLAHSGFLALNNYVGDKDIFGRTIELSQASISGGLAAAAVLVMGEGAEQTPIVLVADVSFVEFQNRNPSQQELSEINLTLENDLFEAFWKSADWKDGTK